MNDFTIFLIALALLVLFIAFFAVEAERIKRILGSVLAAGVTAFSLYYFFTLSIPLGIDLKGGSSFVLEIQADEDVIITPEDQQETIRVLTARLDAGGTADLLIQPSGENRIIIDMPGVSEEQRAGIRETLQKTAKMELRLTHPQSSPALVSMAREGEIFPGYELSEGYDGDLTRSEIVQVRTTISGEHVKNASFSVDQGSPNYYQVNVSLDAEGGEKMFDSSSRVLDTNSGERLAIVVDGKTVSAPGFVDRLGADFRITGQFEREEAAQLSTLLKNPLRYPIEIQSESSISATMGQDTIRQGMMAGITGLGLTLIFVLIYYKTAGFIATLGLAVNVAVIFGVMAMFQFTLTMPGIAGVILTIGIAIDANVLIYERLREEQRAGKSLKAALDAAYEKAFSAIFDANITTLITAIILIWMASGNIKGFAITIMIGVFGTLFASLLVTRNFFQWLIHTGLLKDLKLWNVITEFNFDFLSKRRPAVYASLTVIGLSVLLLGIKGESALGVHLRGGDLVRVLTAELEKSDLEEALADLELSVSPSVQSQNNVGTGETFYSIRVGEDEGPKVIEAIRTGTGVDIDTELESVGSAVGQEMLTSSAWALGLGIIGILLYVTIRFEFAFALGAIAALVHDLIITAGLVVLFGREVSLIMIGAFLTIAGYSINDTIVIFDRVREGLQTRRGNVKDIMNQCINATLSRTILTGVTTLIVLVTLFIFGGPELNDFSFAIIIGVLVGTYSSIFVASPIVLWWARTRKMNLRREVLDTEDARLNAGETGGA